MWCDITLADVRIDARIPDGCPQNSVCVNIVGEIKVSDVQRLKAILAAAKPTQHLQAALNADGDDINSAMELGRVFRKYEAYVFLREGSKCVGSCIFSAAGATGRSFTKGQFAIRRIYNSSLDEMDVGKRQSEYASLRLQVLQYLDEMNVSRDLFQLAQQVPLKSTRSLSSEELSTLLGERDPVYEEAEIAAYANQIGISFQEFLRRDARADKTCGVVDFDCQAAVRWNITTDDYKKRVPIVRERCHAYFNDDKQMTECVRPILLGK